MYLGVLSLLVTDGSVSVFVLAVALTWYIAGNMSLAEGNVARILTALASLLETMIQLLMNTVSFVRVGAFALAHAGLSMAFNLIADSATSILASSLVLIVGNIIVIVLEGLVVSIQTTRLVLFEFFIRFLQANGRVFKPVSGPVIKPVDY